VALGLDTGVGDRRAEDERDEGDEVGATTLEPIADDPEHRDSGKGGREADEDECATRSADEARVRDLPKLLRRDPPVGLENRDGSQSEQEPDNPDFGQARMVRAAPHGHTTILRRSPLSFSPSGGLRS